ncbi:hypothetical protein B4125_2855 [Bacillus paralicheniformis]|nr:hypothetical protein SC10_B2orf05678 [Bacillus paralicheniformis]OLG04783.1 hypothetical protein B4125_2855 [Bacillus paralicheniformis]
MKADSSGNGPNRLFVIQIEMLQNLFLSENNTRYRMKVTPVDSRLFE